MNALNVKKDRTIADIGAGSGYLTVKISERVGAMGTIYAADIQQEMLDYISKRLAEKGIKNVTLVLGTMDDPKLPPNSLDIAILLSTYHEIAQPVDFMKKIKLALKPKGRLAILEFSDESPNWSSHTGSPARRSGYQRAKTGWFYIITKAYIHPALPILFDF